MSDERPQAPRELRVSRDRRLLTVSFGPDETYALEAELLRVRSPSAEVKGHTPAERKTVGGKRDVEIVSVEPVGNYAVRIGFSDMHSSGIYSWSLLREFGADREKLWQDYLAELDEKGLGRDAAPR